MIRLAEPGDAGRIGEIHVSGWRNAYRGIVSDEYLFGKLCVAKRAAYFEKAIAEKSEETYVFDEGGIVKGFMTIGASRDGDKPDAFELWGIYIEPLMKGQGIGTRMISFCEEQAKARGHDEALLWVFKRNEPSRRFYEKMGFLPDGREQTIEFFGEAEVRYAKRV